MKKTVVLSEQVAELIQSMRGKLITIWKEDVGFSSVLDFLAWQGLIRLSELDEDTAVKQLKLLRLSKEKARLEEDVASLWDKIREGIERGEVAIYPKKSS